MWKCRNTTRDVRTRKDCHSARFLIVGLCLVLSFLTVVFYFFYAFSLMQSHFHPARASPPLRLTKANKAPPAPPSIDLSVISSSTVVVPELRNLSHDDINFIDAVVRRAGPLATTFPIVFKAYNDILKERGMDSGEVRYYGKLLKLGTMKGKNWGEKWEAVKREHNQVRAVGSKFLFNPQNGVGA